VPVQLMTATRIAAWFGQLAKDWLATGLEAAVQIAIFW
jgi:hypothetical protein